MSAEVKPQENGKGRGRTLRVVLAALGVAVVGALAFAVVFILPTATGYVAKNACSGVFVAGFPEWVLREQELERQAYVGFEIDREGRRAEASVLGLARRTAVYREGLGCALSIDIAPDVLASQGIARVHAPASDAPWPAGRGIDPRPLPTGVDRDALETALDHAFAEPDPDALRHTRAVVVVQNGRLLAERYAIGTDAETPHLGWSMTKSVTNALVGAQVLRGKLEVDAPAPVPGWANDGRAAVTLDHLLRMSSGLEFEERYGMLADATHMLFEVDDSAAVPLAKPLQHPVDTVWSYSSGTTNIISRIVRNTFDTDDAYWRFPHEALFEPLGMRTAIFETDASGTFVGSSFMYASARDWARFGQLYLQDGLWEGARLLPEGWATYSGTATPTAPKGEYAAQFWANAGAPDDPADRRLPHVPVDAYQASGFQGQAVLIIPSRQVVIVRLGLTHDRAAWDLDTFAAEVLSALPDPA